MYSTRVPAESDSYELIGAWAPQHGQNPFERIRTAERGDEIEMLVDVGSRFATYIHARVGSSRRAVIIRRARKDT